MKLALGLSLLHATNGLREQSFFGGFQKEIPIPLTTPLVADSGLEARFSSQKRGEERVDFANCGTTSRPAGFLSSDHPYKPNTACRWKVIGPPGSRVWVKILKMDIEEERPSDSSTCGSPFNKEHEPCTRGDNELCEWDYLRIFARDRGSRKMCQFVNRFRKFAIQNGIPGTPDYSYFFEDYNYQSDPMFHNVIKEGWFKGKMLGTNEITIEFKSDAGANFYGFDLVWRFTKPQVTTTQPPKATTQPPNQRPTQTQGNIKGITAAAASSSTAGSTAAATTEIVTEATTSTSTTTTTTTAPDPDQCALGTHNCHKEAICTDHDDGFMCSCRSGFEGSGVKCRDIDECETSNVCSVHSDCTNMVGTFACHCKSGFHGNGVTCNEVDECAIGADNCSAAATCINTKGSFACRCNAGFQGNGVMCFDINECALGTDNCDSDGLCMNTIGGFQCRCRPGFKGDGVSCNDVNECATGNPCSPFASCSNTDGGFRCVCKSGFFGNGETCRDVNECSDNTHTCDANATCVNRVGGFGCECNSGFQGDGTVCMDINECATGQDDCDSHARCHNTDGGFNCICHGGFDFDGESCVDIDECEFGVCPSGKCTNTVGHFSCGCPEGFSGSDGNCQDIDECSAGTDTCSADASCTNIDGSFNCACNAGFSDIGFNGMVCRDVDECSDGNNDCDGNSACINNAGGFECVCNSGFSFNGAGVCEDVDECISGDNNCDANANCTNFAGGFTCSCATGFIGTGDECVDVNECANGSNDCHVNSKCINTDGGFSCECKDGFFGDGKTCTDTDECSEGSDDCDANASCVNFAGGFSCSCNAGFIGNGKKCSDMDECDLVMDNCHDHARCINTAGGFECECNNGFIGNGISCMDVDECANESHSCHPDAECTNNAGSFTCKCGSRLAAFENFKGDGHDCVDVDECKTKKDNCDKSAKCVNTSGGFDCNCNPGFAGTGVSCSDIDECTIGTHTCHDNATCINNVGSFSCKCGSLEAEFKDFRGDGQTCVDVDECKTKKDNCHSAATCSNTVGGFDCNCKSGFSGDGLTCTDIDECSTGTHTCDANAACTNTVGSFSCKCGSLEAEFKDFRGDGKTCVDVDECKTKKDNCHSAATCTNTVGGFDCNCKSGFSGDGVDECTDIDECATGSHTCDVNAACTNTVGSFKCKCGTIEADFKDFHGDGKTCEDRDECKAKTDNCHRFANCFNTVGAFECSCKPGFTGDGLACQKTTTERPTTTKKINECKTGTHDCHADALCINRSSGFACQCKKGFNGDGMTCTANTTTTKKPKPTTTKAVNECKTGTHDCHADAFCINRPVGFDCQCKRGFNGDGMMCTENTTTTKKPKPTTTKGVNECTTGTHDCHTNAFCINRPVGFECKCRKGFNGDGFTCIENTTTTKKPKPTTTKGVNECTTGTHDCHADAFCINRPMGFECKCRKGFNGDGVSCTANTTTTKKPKPTTTKGVNECTTGTHDCHADAFCINRAVGFECKCRKGFNGDGMTCTANTTTTKKPKPTTTKGVNECKTGTHDCHADAFCINRPKGFDCQCRKGFHGDGMTCTKNTTTTKEPKPTTTKGVNECKTGAHNCHEFAVCINSLFAFDCRCKKGFTGDGVTCIKNTTTTNEPQTPNPNECKAKKDNCHRFAICTDTEEAFECECKPGFTGDGTLCTRIKKTTTKKPITSSRPGVNGTADGKEAEVAPKVKVLHVMIHMEDFSALKDNMFATIDRVMEDRKGKVHTFATRMKGVGRKALSRRRRKCPLDEDHKNNANAAFDAAQNIGDVEAALLQVLLDRTSEVPPCKNIRKMIGKKVVKIAKRMNRHTHV